MDSALTEFNYQTIVKMRDLQDRPFAAEDLVAGEHRGILEEVAETYVKTYKGTFEYVQDVALQYKQRGYLTAGQAKGILNCVVAEWRRRPKDAEIVQTVDAVVPDGFLIPEGKYTIVRSDAKYGHTLKIRNLSQEQTQKYGLPEGSRIISYLSGSDNLRDYTAFAFVLPNRSLRLYERFKQDTLLQQNAINLLTMNREGVLQTTEAFALKSGRCSICGAELTQEQSILWGMGPICRKKFDL